MIKYLPSPGSLKTSSFLVILLSLAVVQMNGASSPLRRWESTGIVNGTDEFEFSCKNDSKTKIHESHRCDGIEDCQDRSDEWQCTNCTTPFSLEGKDGFLDCLTTKDVVEDRSNKEAWLRYRGHQRSDLGAGSIYYDCIESKLEHIWKTWKENCAEGEFRCSTNGGSICIPSSSACDGIDDCRDSRFWHYYHELDGTADEKNCTECNNGAKMCVPTGKCIASRSICDGKVDCSDGSDEENCTVSTCGGALCGNGQCIASEKVCDGVIDCKDASDEQNCVTSCGAEIINTTKKVVTCNGKKYLKSEVCAGLAPECEDECSDECDCRVAYRCGSGKCIRKEQVCDGKIDCPGLFGGEDEKACLTACAKYPFFSCLNNFKLKCLPMSSKCDGIRDCSDGKDEKNCYKCPDDSHKCDGGCLPSSSRCDGVKDCKDGSDEDKCTCDECMGGHLDTYSCEATGKCMKRSEACRRDKSRCPNATDRDEFFCRKQSSKKNTNGSKHTSRL